MTRLGILGSGSGSNMQALLDSIAKNELEAEIALVLSDRADAFILERAQKVGIPHEIIDCLGYRSKFPAEVQKKVARQLLDARVDLICLAGFMRLIGPPLLMAFPGRILNIHPSLLPAYPGLHAWEKALENGATESGCTVHHVDAGMDTGPIVLQAAVPVLRDDSSGTLHARIQVEEHRLYPEAVRRVIADLKK